MKKFAFAVAVAVASFAFAQPAFAAAAADPSAAYLAKLGGSWSGAGSVVMSAGAAPAGMSCRLSGRPSGESITISGACDGAARGAQLIVVLEWHQQTQRFYGTFQGAAETGTAQLAGRLSGNTLNLRVTSANGGTGNLALSVTGGSARLTVSGRDAKTGRSVNYVNLGLRKG